MQHLLLEEDDGVGDSDGDDDYDKERLEKRGAQKSSAWANNYTLLWITMVEEKRK